MRGWLDAWLRRGSTRDLGAQVSLQFAPLALHSRSGSAPSRSNRIRRTHGAIDQFDARRALAARTGGAIFMPRSLSAGYPRKLSASADRRISMLLLHSHVKFGQVVARKIVPPRKRSVRCGLFQCKSKGI
jgi:hypothetical protein